MYVATKPMKYSDGKLYAHWEFGVTDIIQQARRFPNEQAVLDFLAARPSFVGYSPAIAP